MLFRSVLPLGGPALSLQVVTRRLQGNGTSNLDNRFAWFAKGEAGWGLTTRGRETYGFADGTGQCASSSRFSSITFTNGSPTSPPSGAADRFFTSSAISFRVLNPLASREHGLRA